MRSAYRSVSSRTKQHVHLKDQLANLNILDSEALNNLFRICESSRDLPSLKHIHSHISGSSSLCKNTFLANGLVRAYGKCGSIQNARTTFDSITRKNEFSWGNMLSAYAQNGFHRQVLELYKRMDMEPNAVVYTTAVSACSNLEDLPEGRAIHSRILSRKFKPDILLQNALLTMYSRCGSITEARNLFDQMPNRSVVSWNAMIAAYAQNGHFQAAIDLYETMDLEPSDITFTSVLSACSGLGLLEQGKKIHALVSARKSVPDLALQNALLSMYAKCKSFDEAVEIFQGLQRRDVVSWSAMIGAYAETDKFKEAIELYSNMQLEGVRPNNYTFASVLLACASIGDLRSGKAIHRQIVDNGFEVNLVLGTALVDLYANYGNLEEARSLFDSLSEKDEPLWTMIIAGYAKQGHKIGVLQLYREMISEPEAKLNRMIYCSVISACSNLGAFSEGKVIHRRIVEEGFHSDYILSTCLVNMYTRSGDLDEARRVFDTMAARDTLTWTTVITAYAKHGEYHVALELYKMMELEGAEPSELTFIAVLYACSHAGLQDQGRRYFISIQEDYDMEQNLTHFSCIVDLLSRAGRLRDAEELIKCMPVEPNDITWTSLLGASRIHKDVKRAVHAAEQVSKLDPVDPASYILLSNVHAVTGDVAGMVNIRNTMVARGVKKRRGCSFIEVEGRIHEFSIGDDSHPRFQEILTELRRLSVELKGVGYIPESGDVLHDIDENEKEMLLRLHSEKVAVAFGIISTNPGTTLRIFNTLRICSDCHAACKFVSNIVGREIVVRDSNRFHRFRGGRCSCGDYW